MEMTDKEICMEYVLKNPNKEMEEGDKSGIEMGVLEALTIVHSMAQHWKDLQYDLYLDNGVRPTHNGKRIGFRKLSRALDVVHEELFCEAFYNRVERV